MMNLNTKHAVVTGGSRGLGAGLVEALAARGARVTVVARGADALAAMRARLDVATICADVTDKTAAYDILGQTRPDILVLNAGAKPRMGRLDQLSWEDFSATWETDVKAGLHWLQAALNLPLAAGSRVLLASSGAAVSLNINNLFDTNPPFYNSTAGLNRTGPAVGGTVNGVTLGRLFTLGLTKKF